MQHTQTVTDITKDQYVQHTDVKVLSLFRVGMQLVVVDDDFLLSEMQTTCKSLGRDTRRSWMPR